MEKRNFLKFMALGTSLYFLQSPYNGIKAQSNRDKIKPKALKQGDKVSIIAPGTAVSDPDDILKVREILNSLGLEAKFSDNLMQGTGYKTRTVEERVNDIHNAFLDKETSAVFCIRGGYGSGQLLDSIDYEIIRNNPKIFCGYSDITALHLAISRMTGLVTFHSPVMLSPFTNYTFDIFRKMLFNTEPIGKISNPNAKSLARNSYPIRTINSGVASGQLIGGNLSLITSLIGTKYELQATNHILAIEDVGEAPYRIDRMLNQLRLTGILEQANGIIFGKCNDCSDSGQSAWDWSLGEVIDYYLKPIGKPAFYGLMFGHTAEQATLPMGIDVTMQADDGSIEIKETCTL